MTPAQFVAALKRLELSQEEAAKRLGVTPSAVYRWASGERPIPGPVVAAIRCWEGKAGRENDGNKTVGNRDVGA